MKSASFRLTLLAAALACTGSAQAATARADVARPTDFAAVSVTQGPVICRASKLITCGRQVAGKFGLPAGSAPKAAYRFVEEEFLFDSGVGIFLQTAIGAPRRHGQPDWRQRLAFRKTPEGYQLVQIGVQYRCEGGAWSKNVCGSAARAVASGKGAGSGSGVTAGAGAGAGAGAASAAGAGVTPPGGSSAQAQTGAPDDRARAGAAEEVRTAAAGRVRNLTTADRPQAAPVTNRTAPASDINTRPGTPTQSLQSPGTQEAPVPELDARWRPRQSAVEEDSAASTAFGASGQRRGHADGTSAVVPSLTTPAAGAGVAPHAAAAGGIGVAATAAMADIQQASRAAAPGAAPAAPYAAAPAGRQGGMISLQPGVAPGAGAAQPAGTLAGASKQLARGGAAAAGGTTSREQPADIVAANPSVSADQLKQMREAEASLARATASSAPGVVDASRVPARGQESGSVLRGAVTGAPGMQDLQGVAELPAEASAGKASGAAQTRIDARQDPQRTAAPSSLRVPATQPASVHKAAGFISVVMSPENAAQLARPCEQPIETCGKQVFDTLFEPEAQTLAELPPNQSRRESFIYADQPVTSAVYLVTVLGLPDDALTGQRIRIEFVRRGAGWVTVSAGRQYRCRRGDLARLEWTDRQCQ